MNEAMRNWFMRYRFTHPTTEDFLHTIEEAAIKHGSATATGYTPNAPGSGTALSPASSQGLPAALQGLNVAPAGMTFTTSTLRQFFNQAVYGTQVLDYSIDSISSDKAQWWLPESSKYGGREAAQYRDTVVVRRKGDFILPVTVEMVFDDGTRVREQWDGVDRWTRFTYMRNARIISAEVDPDHLVLMDRDFFNNSITTQGSKLPERKVSAIWTSLVQLVAQLASWIV